MSTETESEQDEAELDQHSSESIAFKEHYQCSDAFYAVLRSAAIECLRERSYDDRSDLDKVQLRSFTFEAGVVSFEATHPHVKHEDEIEGELEVGE